jgi:hypothetical protein
MWVFNQKFMGGLDSPYLWLCMFIGPKMDLLVRRFSWTVHLLDEDVSSREDASTSWPYSSGLRSHRIEDIPYHFKKGTVCQF